MNTYTQASSGAGSQADDQFVHDLLAILGDCRLLWLPNLTDTTTSTDRSRHAATITWSESLASFDATRTKLGAGVAVTFNGTDEEGDVPDADRYSFGDGASDSPFSVIALVSPNVNDAAMSLAAKENAASAEEWGFELNASGHAVARLTDESASGTLTATYATPVGTSDVLLGFSYDGSKANTGLRVYVDGANQSITRGSSGSYVAMENTAALVHLGARYATKQQFFDGPIALVAVTAMELSPDEMWAIKALCNGYFGLDL